MSFNIGSVITNKVIMINITLLIISFGLFYKYKNPYFLFLMYGVCFINEIVNYFTGLDLYDSHSRTELVYSLGEGFSSMISDDFDEVNTNFTEGYFKDDKCIPWEESEQNRFDHFIEILEIEPGDVVLDAGCGFGGLVKYLRSKGINAYGITITKVQYQFNKENIGDYFYYGDYTVYNKDLVNKFDHIIIPGSLEHTFGGNPSFMSTYTNKFEKMKEVFSLMKQYFKPSSTKQKILTTTLHSNLKFKDTYQAYVTERMFGGSYPTLNDYSVADSLRDSGYNVLSNKDYTWHYYYVSYCNLSHFGNPVDIGKKTLLFALINPHIIYGYIYWYFGYWMWMFDGKNHYRRDTDICDPNNGCDLTFEEDMNKRPATLFYTIAQLK